MIYHMSRLYSLAYLGVESVEAPPDAHHLGGVVQVVQGVHQLPDDVVQAGTQPPTRHDGRSDLCYSCVIDGDWCVGMCYGR